MSQPTWDGMQIDCDTCVMKDTVACDDCVVSFLLNRPEGAVVFDADEERALRAMSGAGLLPLMRYRPDRSKEGSKEGSKAG